MVEIMCFFVPFGESPGDINPMNVNLPQITGPSSSSEDSPCAMVIAECVGKGEEHLRSDCWYWLEGTAVHVAQGETVLVSGEPGSCWERCKELLPLLLVLVSREPERCKEFLPLLLCWCWVAAGRGVRNL